MHFLRIAEDGFRHGTQQNAGIVFGEKRDRRRWIRSPTGRSFSEAIFLAASGQAPSGLGGLGGDHQLTRDKSTLVRTRNLVKSRRAM